MRISAGGSVAFAFSDGGFEPGTLQSLRQGTFEIRTTGFCSDGESGQYTETVGGDVLQVQRVNDPCPDRAATLVGRWRTTG